MFVGEASADGNRADTTGQGHLPYGRVDQFCKEHPSKGDWKLFDSALDAMADRQLIA